MNDGDDLIENKEIARLFDPEMLALEEAEERAALSRDVSRAAEVLFDLHQQGALYQFMLDRRADAKNAISAWFDASPTDAVFIAQLQARVKAYVDICRFVERSLIAGKSADEFINETYGPAEEAG